MEGQAVSTPENRREMGTQAQVDGDIAMLVNAAGVSPSQAPVETILNHVYLSHPGKSH